MLSLYVKSFFTNVPIEDALACSETRLPKFHYSDTKIKSFINLTKICTTQTTFEFDNIFLNNLTIIIPYHNFCDIYMHYFEEKLLNLANFLNNECLMLTILFF